jgi:hypothetical protein
MPVPLEGAGAALHVSQRLSQAMPAVGSALPKQVLHFFSHPNKFALHWAGPAAGWHVDT